MSLVLYESFPLLGTGPTLTGIRPSGARTIKMLILFGGGTSRHVSSFQQLPMATIMATFTTVPAINRAAAPTPSR